MDDTESLLLECSRDRDALVREFDAWRIQRAGDMPLREALEAWTLARWPQPLPRAAFGMLLHAARTAEREGPPPVRFAKCSLRQVGEPVLDYLERLAVTNGWMARGAEPAKDMPQPPAFA
jgi:hypothetical protein